MQTDRILLAGQSGTLNPSGSGLRLAGQRRRQGGRGSNLNLLMSVVGSNPTLALNVLKNIIPISQQVLNVKRNDKLLNPEQVIKKSLLNIGITLTGNDIPPVLELVKFGVNHSSELNNLINIITSSMSSQTGSGLPKHMDCLRIIKQRRLGVF